MNSIFQTASQFAPEVDALALRLFCLSAFLVALVFSLILFFCIRYRAGSRFSRDQPPVKNSKLEGSLIVLILIFGVSTFWSSAKLYYSMYTPPKNSQEIFGVAKQWLWIFHAPGGKDQINELTVTLNQPTKLTLISEDVIHSLYIPAFRVKQDVLPNRYTSLWFTATKLGDYPLFCTQFCGLSHSKMLATVHVVSATQSAEISVQNPGRGEKLFQEKGCMSCHQGSGSDLGPNLAGLYGQRVSLTNGQTVLADDEYLRESILIPSAKVVRGYRDLMPSFQGVLNPSEVHELIEYIKTWKVKTP